MIINITKNFYLFFVCCCCVVVVVVVFVAVVVIIDINPDEIILRTRNENLAVCHLDFSDLYSVRKFAEEILRKEARIDILVSVMRQTNCPVCLEEILG
ncbi:hypothetical protein Avbf_13701 [Armadillidium vulgare]|nr:hypothetical protein Avbf_13701 [Armadillidium vulgare]